MRHFAPTLTYDASATNIVGFIDKSPGSLILRSNTFTAFTVNANYVINATTSTGTNAAVTSMGNQYPNANPFAPSATLDLTEIGDRYLDGSLILHPILNRTVGFLSQGGTYSSPQALGSVSGSVTCDTASGNECDMTLAGNVTSFTLRNSATPNAGQRVIVKISQDATGGRTFAWPSNAKFPGGTAPTVTPTANKTDIFTFISNGTNFYQEAPPAQNL